MLVNLNNSFIKSDIHFLLFCFVFSIYCRTFAAEL